MQRFVVEDFVRDAITAFNYIRMGRGRDLSDKLSGPLWRPQLRISVMGRKALEKLSIIFAANSTSELNVCAHKSN